MPKGLADLVGRAMTDADFLADLQRSPDTLLAQYQLNDDERAAVRRALVRLAEVPAGQRGQALRSELVRRVAT
jgi:hypothetical protein